jgi:Na+/H+-dicarboxylate symporter
LRWKLLVITSFVAALLNVAGTLGLAYWTKGVMRPLGEQPVLMVGVIIIPLVVTTLAAVFVYRHTARRRKLQATLTVLFSITLTLAALLARSNLLPRPAEVRLSRPALAPRGAA